MIIGIGTDIIEIERIKKYINKNGERGITRVFTPAEIKYCSKKGHNAESFAGRFAAKEALLKATGLGLRNGLRWKDFEIINDDMGKPHVHLYGKAVEIFANCRILLSISHNHQSAVAFAIVEKEV